MACDGRAGGRPAAECGVNRAGGKATATGLGEKLPFEPLVADKLKEGFAFSLQRSSKLCKNMSAE